MAQGASSLEELIKELEQGIRKKDVGILYNLFYWKGTEPKIKHAMESTINDLTEVLLKRVSLESLPQGFQHEFLFNNVRYKRNLEALGIVKIDFEKGSNLRVSAISLPYAMKDQRYFFPVSVKSEIAAPPTSSSLSFSAPKPISFVIGGTVAPHKVKFAGACAYTSGGLRKTVAVSGEGNHSINVSGESVERCEIQRVTPFGKIQLLILVDGKEVFDSPWVEGEAPLIYIRDDSVLERTQK